MADKASNAKRCPWIRLDVDLDQHPKLGKLAEAMKCDDERALARLVRFWMGVRVHAPEGNLSGVSPATIGGWMRAPGRASVAWVEALKSCNFIAGEEVVGWAERQLGVVEKAKRDALRLKEDRIIKAAAKAASEEESRRAFVALSSRDEVVSVALSSRVSGSGSGSSSKNTNCLFDAAAPNHPETESPKKSGKPPTDTTKVVRAYAEAHRDFTGRDPQRATGAENKLALDALKGGASVEEIERLLPVYFAASDAPSCRHFFTQIDRWRGLLAKQQPSAAAENHDARRARRHDALCGAVFQRMGFRATCTVPALYGNAPVELQADERNLGVQRGVGGRLQDFTVEPIDMRLFEALEAAAVPDASIAEWAASAVVVLHKHVRDLKERVGAA